MNQYMPEGMLITSDKNYEYTSNLEGLERAMRSNVILEGIATLCDHNFNLHINPPCFLIEFLIFSPFVTSFVILLYNIDYCIIKQFLLIFVGFKSKFTFAKAHGNSVAIAYSAHQNFFGKVVFYTLLNKAF